MRFAERVAAGFMISVAGAILTYLGPWWILSNGGSSSFIRLSTSRARSGAPA